MPVRLTLSSKVQFRASAFEIPLDLENLEAAIVEVTRTAVLRFLGDEMVAVEDRDLEVTVQIEEIAMTDADGRGPIGVRRSEM